MSEVTSESQVTVPSGITTTPEEDLKPEGGPMSQVHVAQILEMVVTPTVELIAPEHQILPMDDHPELNLDMHMSLQDVPDSRNEEPTKFCHQESVTDAISDTCESVTKIPLNGDIVDGCKALCQNDIVSSENIEGNTLRNVCLSTRGEGSSTASISVTLGREEKLLVSCDTLRCASGLECCNMLAATVTGLETLNSVDEASNQSKGWPSVTTACCLEQQLHSTEGESTEVDKLVDFHCLESDADILGELQDDHWLDPFSVPTNPNDAHVTSLTHAMTAWDVTDPVVKTPSGELVPNQGEIGEYVGDGEFKKKDGADNIHTTEEFGSCENQGNQFEQKLLGSQVDFPLVTSSMKPQSEEVARISQVVGTKIAWEVDITELIGKKGRGKRPRKNVTADCGRLDHKTADLRKGRPLGQECQVSSRAVKERKMLDLRRWYCISRPQYKTSCGISSVVSCWNFLFSSLGVGIHQPITQEEALTLLGFQQPYGDIKFGPFTGNNTLLMWFRAINRYHGVRGRGFYLYKPHGKNRTAGMTSQDALAQLKKGLAGTDVAYVYHCLNHYFCPIGFEDTPRNAESAYQEDTDSEEIDTWILIGDTSRKHPSMHCKRWEDISADLNNQNPDFLDVRRLWCGPQQRQSKKKGGNLHCIMGFQRCEPPRYKTRKHKKAESTSTCAPAERDGIPDTDPATQPLSRPRPVREVKSFSGINHGATFKDDARNIARSRGKHSRSCDAF